ncbi:hypothetical protein DSECCO2_614020 [anaerobic digester metagenome]
MEIFSQSHDRIATIIIHTHNRSDIMGDIHITNLLAFSIDQIHGIHTIMSITEFKTMLRITQLIESLTTSV